MYMVIVKADVATLKSRIECLKQKGFVIKAINRDDILGVWYIRAYYPGDLLELLSLLEDRLDIVESIYYVGDFHDVEKAFTKAQ